MYVIIKCMCKALSEQKCTSVGKMEYSESVSESDHAMSTMTSRTGQASNAESTIPDNFRRLHSSASNATLQGRRYRGGRRGLIPPLFKVEGLNPPLYPSSTAHSPPIHEI